LQSESLTIGIAAIEAAAPTVVVAPLAAFDATQLGLFTATGPSIGGIEGEGRRAESPSLCAVHWPALRFGTSIPGVGLMGMRDLLAGATQSADMTSTA